MRDIAADRPIVPEDDRLRSVYCSEACQRAADTQSLSLLIGKEVPLPVEMPGMPPIEKDKRSAAQQAFADLWQQSQSSAFLMTAKLAAMQVLAELSKVLQLDAIKSQMPDVCVKGEYTIFDHLERLRFTETPAPQGEHEALKNVLNTSLPFLDDIHNDERHSNYRAKLAYNSLGVAFGDNRSDKACLPIFQYHAPRLTAPQYGFNENFERARTPLGSVKQVGSGLYLVSSYVSARSGPVFACGRLTLSIAFALVQPLSPTFLQRRHHGDATGRHSRH